MTKLPLRPLEPLDAASTRFDPEERPGKGSRLIFRRAGKLVVIANQRAE
jgi:hypothetical protein